MCTGAARMATVGALTYVGAEPVNGTARALAHERYVRHRPVEVAGPRTDVAGRFASVLALAFVPVRKPSAPFVTVVTAFRDRRPDLAAVSDALIVAGLTELAEHAVPWEQAAPGLLAATEAAGAEAAGGSSPPADAAGQEPPAPASRVYVRYPDLASPAIRRYVRDKR
jgi:hypothetical protein